MSAALRNDNGNSDLNPAMKPQVYVHGEQASTSANVDRIPVKFGTRLPVDRGIGERLM